MQRLLQEAPWRKRAKAAGNRLAEDKADSLAEARAAGNRPAEAKSSSGSSGSNVAVEPPPKARPSFSAHKRHQLQLQAAATATDAAEADAHIVVLMHDTWSRLLALWAFAPQNLVWTPQARQLFQQFHAERVVTCRADLDPEWLAARRNLEELQVLDREEAIRALLVHMRCLQNSRA